MTIEAQLAEHTEILKAILTTLQSGAAIPAATGTPTVPAAEEKKTRGKGKDNKAADDKSAGEKEAADPLGLVDGDASGTRYWVSEALSQVYTQKPGDPDPKEDSFKIESAAAYLAKKDEFAKKSAAAAEAQKPAASEPSATAGQATASGASFEDVTKAIMARNQELAKTDPDAGRKFVLDLLAKFLPAGTEKPNVRMLEALKKNDEILAHVNAQAQTQDAGADLF